MMSTWLSYMKEVKEISALDRQVKIVYNDGVEQVVDNNAAIVLHDGDVMKWKRSKDLSEGDKIIHIR